MDSVGLLLIQDYSFYVDFNEELVKEYNHHQKIMSKGLKNTKKQLKKLNKSKAIQKNDQLLTSDLRITLGKIRMVTSLKTKITDEFINRRFSIKNDILKNNKKIEISNTKLLTHSLNTNPFIQI